MKITDKKGVKVTPEMIGLFFEDINFAADGGLYAEMIENRSFEAKEAFGTPGNFYSVDDNGYAWKPYTAGGLDKPRMQYIMGTPLSEANPHYLRFTATEAGQGFSNKAYDGIRLHKGMKYNVSFYARCVEYTGNNFIISVNKDGKIYGKASVEAVKAIPYIPFSDLKIDMEQKDPVISAQIEKINQLDTEKMSRCNDWIKYDVVITADNDVSGADFTISLDGAGVIEFDLISMIPEDAVDGIFRRDLFEALAAIKPGFIRFPGGCIVEGTDLDTRYEWKNSVGAPENRPLNENRWRDTFPHRLFPNYYQSLGLGFYEYFLLSEKIGAEPLPILSVGLACQYQNDDKDPNAHVAVKDLQSYIDDALDLIEFANGPVTSKWGKLRADMGHPAPFNLKQIGIGNEQWGPMYPERLQKFMEQIHAKYPKIKICGSSGPSADGKDFDYGWEQMRKLGVDMVDEHYYKSPEWFRSNASRYDKYDRKGPKVFAGEYAAHAENDPNSWEAALSEAAFMTGLERNADVVYQATYAPLFAHVEGWQWRPDLIWFDNLSSVRSANYYVQQLYGENKGTNVLKLTENGKAVTGENGLYATACFDKATKSYIVKIANTSNEAKEINVTLDRKSVV